MTSHSPTIRAVAARTRPVAELVVTTMALNVLGLTVPLAAAQIFDRVIPSPGTATLSVLAVAVLALGAVEAFLRYGRASILARAGANFAGAMTQRVLSQVVLSDPQTDGATPSKSIDYLAAVGQLREKYNGQILVSLVELLFLPMMLAVIFAISWIAGVIILVTLCAFALISLKEMTTLRRLVRDGQVESEARYEFLFTMLSAMHAIKAMGIEDNILRRYEALQARITRGNYRLARVTGHILNSGPVASQAIVAMSLAFGALAVSSGDMTMGSVSALVIIASRVMAPVQRAVFVFVQMKDIEVAERRITSVLQAPHIASPVQDLAVDNEGSVTLDDVSLERDGRTLFTGVNISIRPGEAIALSGADASANSGLLKLIAGIVAPTSGDVRLNGVPPTHYPQELLNLAVGYVPSNGVMFRGTIGDNITRFGEVKVEAAMEVAAIMEIDGQLRELPNGLETELVGSATETIPPGLVQQLVLLRALATRPRFILLDNADRGLDQAGYAKLHRFIGKIHGQASMVILSDDANLASYARGRFGLTPSGLTPLLGGSRERTAYRDLRV